MEELICKAVIKPRHKEDTPPIGGRIEKNLISIKMETCFSENIIHLVITCGGFFTAQIYPRIKKLPTLFRRRQSCCPILEAN